MSLGVRLASCWAMFCFDLVTLEDVWSAKTLLRDRNLNPPGGMLVVWLLVFLQVFFLEHC
jgi:hypothetical protein